MDMKAALTIFLTVFLAELGDKTQLATVLYASKRDTSLAVVFVAASLALVASTALAVAVGSFAAAHLDSRYVTYAAGVGFIAVGIWTMWKG